MTNNQNTALYPSRLRQQDRDKVSLLVRVVFLGLCGASLALFLAIQYYGLWAILDDSTF